MRRYKLILHPDAELDIKSSFEWGCRYWGKENAQAWLRQLRRTFKSRLTSTPHACPFAPESEELGISVRQLIVNRYRVLFIVEKRVVTVLHVRGSYVAKPEPGERL